MAVRLASFASALAAAAVALLLTVATAVAAVDDIKAIQAKGVLVVGVKADYRPWGFIDPSGAIVGMEIDMAREIADKLGVRLEMVPVTTANRIEFLRQGRIDLILATMSDTPARRQASTVIDPPYYAGGTNILARKSLNFQRWQELRGRRVCALQGAYYNRPVAENWGAIIVAFPGVPEAMIDLLAGNCDAFVQDSSLIASTLVSDPVKWADYEMPMETFGEQAWVMAVSAANREGSFARFLTHLSQDWHRSGHLIALEKKWGIPPSPFLKSMHDKL